MQAAMYFSANQMAVEVILQSFTMQRENSVHGLRIQGKVQHITLLEQVRLRVLHRLSTTSSSSSQGSSKQFMQQGSGNSVANMSISTSQNGATCYNNDRCCNKLCSGREIQFGSGSKSLNLYCG